MIERPTAPLVLGLEINAFYLRGVLIGFKKNQTSLIKTFKIKTNRDAGVYPNVKLLYIDNQEEDLQQSANKSLVITALPTSETLVRQLEIQLTNEQDIDKVLEFQAETILPYPIENGIIDRVVLEKKKEGSILSIVAARKDHIKEHLSRWQELNIEPEVVTSIPSALAAFSHLFSPSQQEHILINLGTNETTCVLVENGKPLAAQVCHFGLQNLVDTYAKDNIEDFDFSLLSNQNQPELTQAVGRLRLEIMKTAYALLKQSKKIVTEILLTGEGVSWNNLSTTLVQDLKKTIILPQEKGQYPLSIAELQEFACCIGLALIAATEISNQTNFRQKELSYPYPWKRLKKPIAAFLVLCGLFAGSLYFYTNAYVKNKEHSLKKEYVELLVSMNKPLDEFEKGLKKKSIGPQKTEEAAFDLSTLSSDDIQFRLSVIEKEIKATPEVFPLLPNIPRVSDVLAWLASLPLIKQSDTEDVPKIKLESFSYKMIKRPDQNKKKEKYQAKVEMEFSASTPTYSREFHDVLLTPNDLIDPNADINWNAERGKYRASFFLKDKTIYPTGKN